MPTYRCRNCRKHTEFLDEPPCGEDCDARFQEVVTIHYHDPVKTGRPSILCNGKDPFTTDIRSNSVFAVATCPRCIRRYMERAKQKVEQSAESDRMQARQMDKDDQSQNTIS